MNSFLLKVLLPVGVALLVLLVFWPGLTGGFLFDDYHNIVDNASVQIKALSWSNLWAAANAYSGGTRQLAMATFALNAYFSGIFPWSFKLTGLIVHAVNAALIYVLAMQLLTITKTATVPQRCWVAAVVALVWAVHPLQVSSALYVVQRMETLCYTFIILALIFYLHARVKQIQLGGAHWGWWLAVALSGVLAFLSKETAILLPLFLLVFEWCLFNFKGSTKAQQRFWKYSYLTGCLVALLGFVFWAVPHYASVETHYGRDFNTYERLLTQTRVLMLYLKEIVLPIPNSMTFYYDDMVNSSGWLSPISTLWSALFLLTLFVIAVLVRQHRPLISLGILVFFASHFLTSNIIALEMVFEHRNYFALFGALLVGVDLISRVPLRDGPGLKYLAVGVLTLTVSSLGWVRAATWGNPVLLAMDMVRNNPDSARAKMDLGLAYFELSEGDVESPFYQFAAQQFEQASELPYAKALSDVNLILMEAGAGLPFKDDNDIPMIDIDKVWQRLLYRLQTEPMSVENRTPVWSLLAQRQKDRRIDDARLQLALNIVFERSEEPDYRYAQVADYYLTTVNNEQKAEEYYLKAAKLAKEAGYAQLIESIVGNLVESGHFDLATKVNDLL